MIPLDNSAVNRTNVPERFNHRARDTQSGAQITFTRRTGRTFSPGTIQQSERKIDGNQDCRQIQMPQVRIGKNEAAVGRHRRWHSSQEDRWHIPPLAVEFDQYLQVRLGFGSSATSLQRWSVSLHFSPSLRITFCGAHWLG
jgi:hypothetical protein